MICYFLIAQRVPGIIYFWQLEIPLYICFGLGVVDWIYSENRN